MYKAVKKLDFFLKLKIPTRIEKDFSYFFATATPKPMVQKYSVLKFCKFSSLLLRYFIQLQTGKMIELFRQSWISTNSILFLIAQKDNCIFLALMILLMPGSKNKIRIKIYTSKIN